MWSCPHGTRGQREREPWLLLDSSQHSEQSSSRPQRAHREPWSWRMQGAWDMAEREGRSGACGTCGGRGHLLIALGVGQSRSPSPGEESLKQ